MDKAIYLKEKFYTTAEAQGELLVQGLQREIIRGA
jgi:hypothetical protein